MSNTGTREKVPYWITFLLISAIFFSSFGYSSFGSNLPNENGWKDQVANTAEALTEQCADLLFIGVRGSGETSQFGKTISAIRDQLKTGLSDISTRQVDIDYPAADVGSLSFEDFQGLLLDNPLPETEYMTSANTGAGKIQEVLADSASRCPSEVAILAGYSQGAQAVTQALATNSFDKNFGGVILVGNPFHAPSQQVRQLDTQSSTNGVGLTSIWLVLRQLVDPQPGQSREVTVPKLLSHLFDLYEGRVPKDRISTALESGNALIPQNLRDVTYSICLPGDLICDSLGAVNLILTGRIPWEDSYSSPSSAHKSYFGNRTSKTVNSVVDHTRALVLTAQQEKAKSEEQDSSRFFRPPAILQKLNPGWIIGALLLVFGLLHFIFFNRQKHRLKKSGTNSTRTRTKNTGEAK